MRETSLGQVNRSGRGYNPTRENGGGGGDRGLSTVEKVSLDMCFRCLFMVLKETRERKSE